MAVCVKCKKEIGFLNATRPLWEGTEEMLCSKCWSKIGADFINNPQMEDIDRFIKEGFTEDGLEYLRGYYAYVQEMRPANIWEKRLYDDHMLTTGCHFEGYWIERYIALVTGSVVLGTGFRAGFSAMAADFSGTFCDEFETKLEDAKDEAIKKLIRKSVGLGGNAVIGIDIDYMQIGGMVGVIANGTSVSIKPLAGRP